MKSGLPMRQALGLVIGMSISATLLAQKTPQQIEQARRNVLTDAKVSAVLFSEERQTPSLIRLKDVSYSKAQAQLALNNYLNVRQGIDYLMPDKTTSFLNNVEVVEFQQYFKGIKVDRSKFKAFIKNGQVRFYNGSWYDVPAGLAVQPRLAKESALGYAKAKIGARRFATDVITEKINATTNSRVKLALTKELEDASPKGELVIVQDFNKSGVAEVKLAYKFNIYAAEPLSRHWVYIDANSGNTLLVDAIIKHADDFKGVPSPTSSATTVQTRYAGNRSIYVKQASGNDSQNGLLLESSHPTTEVYVPGSNTWILNDDTRGGGIETYDLNGVGGLPLSIGAFYSQGKSFTDVDNNWTLAEHKRGGGEGGAFEAENDDIAWDAHWGAEVVYDYWKAKHNRLSYDGNDAKIRSFVHYGPAYDNAFWNGSVMTYGDGSGPSAGGFKALTSLDVCGHEIGHGVCSNTSDLVYASESGAMNEALSDIWASCIEYFAIKRVDPSLQNIYKVFSVGEQIAADPNHPLRRMDSPQAEGDPDTYGGNRWKNPICTPTALNDQCGVHTNSGVLNKWFYLITVGSGAGSGPDAAFAGTDDGINDKGNAYAVNGVGFDVSENIVYLTELLLTSTATYAEAREVSIAVANEVSGNPCSALTETLTNAWYAVGVGNKFVKPCTITYGFVMQPGSSTSEGSTPSGCNSTKTVNISVILPPNSTASIALSGTATQGGDYTVSTTSLSNNTAELSKQTIAVTIKNDGVVEGDETVKLTATVSNAGTNPVNTSYTLTIIDDDVVPVIGNGAKTLLTETFTRTDGFTDPTGWKEVLEIPEGANGDPTAAGKNQWGIFDNKLAITGKEGATGTQLPNGTYNDNSPSQTLIVSPLIDARGLSVISIKFDYTIQGEVDAQGTDPAQFPAFDYMAIAYSLDGVNFTELTSGEFRQFASAQPTSGSVQAALPASLANKQFYIAFRWKNDTNAGGPFSTSIDNLSITGSPRTIENDLGHNGRENLNAGQEVYFYSVQDGQALGRVKNGSTKDFGCTNVYVEKTGNGAFNLYQGGGGLHKVADKIIRVEPSVASKVSNTVALYFTEAQLQGLEAATGKNRTEMYVYVVGAAGYAQAANNNTKKYTPVYTAIPGIGGFYTVTFSDYVSGSYALGYPVTLFTGNNAVTGGGVQVLSDRWQFASVYPNPGSSNAYLQVSAPEKTAVKLEIVNTLGQLVFTQSEQLPQGVSRISLKMSKLSSGSYMIRTKAEDGTLLNTQTFVKQ